MELIYERGRKKKLKTVRKELNCNFKKSASGVLEYPKKGPSKPQQRLQNEK